MTVLKEFQHEKLMRAGYDDAQATLLLLWRVDTTEAADLLRRGCEPSTALKILEPLAAH